MTDATVMFILFLSKLLHLYTTSAKSFREIPTSEIIILKNSMIDFDAILRDVFSSRLSFYSNAQLK